MKNLFVIACAITAAGILAPIHAAAIEISSLPESAQPGDNITVAITTQPHAKCRIEALGLSLTQVFALKPTEADERGKASWTFEIAKSYKADELPIVLTSSSGSGVDEKVMVELKMRKAVPDRLARLQFESQPKMVTPGEEITVAVVTNPGAKLKIDAQDMGVNQAFNLGDKTADARGKAAWTFTVDNEYKANAVPVVITENFKGHEKKLACTIPVRRAL